MSIHHRGLIVIAIMSATLMQVLDTTIVNVALPHMQGSLGAAPDQISWTLTSYLVASAIVMPLTGYFAERLGRKSYLLWCILGFTLASIFCGMATSLEMMVTCRLLQGVFGAALVPLSQAILLDIYPKEELGKAMAIWGAGVTVGPILGPTLGGYLTEIANWRWTFYINVPIGILALVLAWRYVPETVKKLRTFDWWGFILLALAIGALQYFLDCGNQKDWFATTSIQVAAVVAVLGFIGFITYAYRGHAFVNLAVFKDRNFVIASLMILILGIGLYGSMVIQPLLLESLLHYPVLDTGLMMTPRAISAMLSMILVGKIIHRVDPRLLMLGGVLLSVIGLYACTYYTLEINKFWLLWPLFLQGLGMGIIFVPLSVVAFATLSDELRVEAAGLNSLIRTISGSIGIAVTLAVFTRNSQKAWNQLVGFIQPYNPVFKSLQLPQGMLAQTMAQQAQMLAFLNIFVFIMWSFIVMIPFIVLMRSRRS